MEIFKIIREGDESGVSGLGHVLDGVIFDDGTCVVRWRTKLPSTAIYPSFKDFKAIHIDAHPENKTIIMRLKIDTTRNNVHSWRAFEQAEKIGEQLIEGNFIRKEDALKVRGIIQIVIEEWK